MSNKHTPDDTIFDLQYKMKKDIESLLQCFDVKYSNVVALALMGAILPYMVAFTYHDSDPLYYFPGDKPNETLAERILRDGKIVSLKRVQGVTTNVIVKAFGQTYKIINPFGNNPKIIQEGVNTK